jgi:hypothetical protein
MYKRGEMVNVYIILVRRPEGKKPLVNLSYRWRIILTDIFNKIRCGCVGWIQNPSDWRDGPTALRKMGFHIGGEYLDQLNNY